MDITATESTRSRQEFRDPTRVLTSLLAPLEKRCLIWLAGRLPWSINSDHLTVLALAAMVAAGTSYWMARATPIGLLLAALSLAVNWFGDSLDGTLARVRRQQRPRYGFYVDHVVDAVGAACLFGGMALSGYMSPLVALVLLVAYLLVCIELYLATHCLGTFTMSLFKIGPTELRILLAVGNLAVFLHPTTAILGYTFRLFDVGGVMATLGLGMTLIVSATKNTRALYRADPRPE
jgi:archaetidylinositol phosphate synthase